MVENYLQSIKKQFEYYKLLGEKTFAQLAEADLFWQYNPESNSIAIIVNHLWGNMRSRWTDFLTADGEKEWRNRDREFEDEIKSVYGVRYHQCGKFRYHRVYPQSGTFHRWSNQPAALPLCLPRWANRADRKNDQGRGVGEPVDPKGEIGSVQPGKICPGQTQRAFYG